MKTRFVKVTGTRMILLFSLGLGILIAASQVGIAESPSFAAARVESMRPVIYEPPRHWMYPSKDVGHDFVRTAEDRDLEWIRGDGY